MCWQNFGSMVPERKDFSTPGEGGGVRAYKFKSEEVRPKIKVETHINDFSGCFARRPTPVDSSERKFFARFLGQKNDSALLM